MIVPKTVIFAAMVSVMKDFQVKDLFVVKPIKTAPLIAIAAMGPAIKVKTDMTVQRTATNAEMVIVGLQMRGALKRPKPARTIAVPAEMRSVMRAKPPRNVPRTATPAEMAIVGTLMMVPKLPTPVQRIVAHAAMVYARRTKVNARLRRYTDWLAPPTAVMVKHPFALVKRSASICEQ